VNLRYRNDRGITRKIQAVFWSQRFIRRKRNALVGVEWKTGLSSFLF